jgi:hypothetical protein
MFTRQIHLLNGTRANFFYLIAFTSVINDLIPVMVRNLSKNLYEVKFNKLCQSDFIQGQIRKSTSLRSRSHTSRKPSGFLLCNRKRSSTCLIPRRSSNLCRSPFIAIPLSLYTGSHDDGYGFFFVAIEKDIHIKLL